MSSSKLLLGEHTFHDPVLAEWAKVARDLDAQMSTLVYLATAYAGNMLGQLTTTGLYMSLHTASPATTGANEILGSSMNGYSSGGYTGLRQTISWASYDSSNNWTISSNTQTFPLLAQTSGTGIPYFGIWTDTGASGHAGTYICGGATSGLGTTIPSGANVIFATGAIKLTQTG